MLPLNAPFKKIKKYTKGALGTTDSKTRRLTRLLNNRTHCSDRVLQKADVMLWQNDCGNYCEGLGSDI